MSLVALAAHAEPAWTPGQYPFLPKVSDGTAPVCAFVAKAYQAAFESPRASLAVEDFLGDTGHPMQWVKWDTVALPFKTISAEDTLYRADLTLESGGGKQTVVYSSVQFSWRGPTYKAAVFKDAADFDKTLAASTSIDDLFTHVQVFFGDSQDIGEWYWNDLFPYAGAYYFIDQQPDFFNVSDVTVYRVQADGKRESACDIAIMPGKQETDRFTGQPGIGSYLAVLWAMGSGGPDMGTLHSGQIHDMGVTGAIERAAARPWATSRGGGGYYGYSRDLEIFLNDWGYSDPWSLREYDSFLEHRAPAKQSLQRYLMERFALPQDEGAVAAEQVSKDLLAAFFEMPSSYFQFRRDDRARQSIAEGGLAGEGLKSRDLDGLLAFAVENPKALSDLLSRGAGVNSSNDFGKTPLMYAAHLDRPDTVALLLKAGADPNAVTHDIAWGEKFERSGRSALMYAAENASLRVMALLIAAGAKTDVEDSRGNGLDYYLAKNPYLTPEQQKLGIVELVKQSGTAPVTPSFDCAKATTRVEKAICADDMLTLEDRELGVTYRALRTIHPDDRDVADDQMSWLKRRDSYCGQQTDDYLYKHCLQRMTRARTRYLQERAQEGIPEEPTARPPRKKARRH